MLAGRLNTTENGYLRGLSAVSSSSISCDRRAAFELKIRTNSSKSEKTRISVRMLMSTLARQGRQ